MRLNAAATLPLLLAAALTQRCGAEAAPRAAPGVVAAVQRTHARTQAAVVEGDTVPPAWFAPPPLPPPVLAATGREPGNGSSSSDDSGDDNGKHHHGGGIASALGALSSALSNFAAAQPLLPSSPYATFNQAAMVFPGLKPLSPAVDALAAPPGPPIFSTSDPTALIYVGPKNDTDADEHHDGHDHEPAAAVDEQMRR